MTLAPAFLLVCGCNALLYVTIRREWLLGGRPLKHRGDFLLAAVVGELAVQQPLVRAVFAGGAEGFVAVLDMFILTAAGTTFWPFAFFLLSELYDRARRGLSDAEGMTVEPTFHQAEAAMKRRDWHAAEALLRAAIEEDPRCPAARLLLAEVLRARGDVAASADALRAALPLLPTREGRAATLFRLFDLLLAHDPRAAAAVIRRVQADFRGTSYAEMASSRLLRLGASARCADAPAI